LQNRELASAAIVGNENPSRSLPPELSDCHWVQPGVLRLACRVQVFLPPGYFDGDRHYPVLYLLHGWGGWDTGTHDSEWDKYNTFGIADNMMRTGQMPPLIIVVPEGDHSYWFNHAGDNARWGDYVATDLVNYVDATFRTLPRRESRAIGGLSMGGLGAIQLALNHPDEFSVVGMRSPTLRRAGDPDDALFFGDANYYANYDPFVLVNRVDAVNQLALYVIIGDKDMWLDRTLEFRNLLDQKQAHYEWHVYPGGHDGPFFGSHLDEELRFYGAHLAIN
jgi:enterochelin esterase-like enzyme